MNQECIIDVRSKTSNPLIHIFNQHPNVEVLSLDCFDTILFRNALEPNDAFYDLANYPVHRDLNCSQFVRKKIEYEAYKKSMILNGTEQVSLEQMYQYAYSNQSDDVINVLVKEELDCEIRCLYASKKAIELIRHAYANKKKIIIVSDTYFTTKQLTGLLKDKLPRDVFAMISKVYASCDRKVGKSKGLFQNLLTELNIKAKQMLHIGDNLAADFDAPNKLGINAHRLKSYDDSIFEQMRVLPLVAKSLDPNIRHKRGLNFFCKDLISDFISEEAVSSIAPCVSMVLYSFAKYLQEEIRILKTQHKNLKIVFLLRDAYLPFEVFNLIENTDAKLARVSRFSSFAASFRSKEDIVNYLATRVQSGKYKEMLKQLLLPEEVATKILRKTLESKSKERAFLARVLKNNVVNTIIENSKKYSERLFKYLSKTTGLKQGDTLLLVDLGYTGTTQICLEPIYKSEYDINVIGRYLVSLASPGSAKSHQGLLDCMEYDDKSLIAAVTYIAIFEQICTAVDNSVVDFDEDGEPIYTQTSTDNKQKESVRVLQDAALKFTQSMLTCNEKQQLPNTYQDYKDTALFQLCRLIYAPTCNEIEYFYDFSHDVNLGTDDAHKLYDLTAGWTDLSKYGWLQSIKSNHKELRMNYPTEWRAFDLSLTTTLLSQHMSDFSLTISDLSKRKLKIEVLIQADTGADLVTIEAIQTFDGAYKLSVPVVNNVNVGVAIGKRLKSFELMSAAVENPYITNIDEEKIRQVETELLYDNINILSGAVCECADENGMIIYAPEARSEKTEILHLLIRPLGGLMFDLA